MSATPAMPTSPQPATSMMARLRAETRDAHDLVEGLPYSESILDETVSRGRYIAQLHAWHAAHVALEGALEASPNDRVRAVWDQTAPRAGWLAQDLEALDPQGLQAMDAVQRGAYQWARAIEEVAASDPVGLLGHLYVLEGSSLGGMVLCKHLGAALELTPEAGLRYYTGYGRETAARWRVFKARMDEAVDTPEAQERVLDQARRAFEHIAGLLEALSAGL